MVFGCLEFWKSCLVTEMGRLVLAAGRSSVTPCEGWNRWLEESLEEKVDVGAVRLHQNKYKGLLKKEQIHLLMLYLYCNYLAFHAPSCWEGHGSLASPWQWWKRALAAGVFALTVKKSQIGDWGLLMPAVVAWSWATLLVHAVVGFCFCHGAIRCSYQKASGASDIPDLILFLRKDLG